MIKILPKKWINNGKEPFSLHNFHLVRNQQRLYINKPKGGFWLSEYTPNQKFPSHWHWLAKSNGYSLKPNNYIYILTDHPNIFIIKNKADYNKLISFYCIKYSNPLISEISLNCIDFEELNKDWNGIYLTENGLEETSTCFEHPNFSSWDCSSLIIFDPIILNNYFSLQKGF
ncbi:hypothetical protein [Bacillus tuaregi]|uniref:hypothetical protein n=1 Tax=Bacillus tuaregi TaxID=1816695 RepID=UPI001113DAB9|nr:hypothetical protein [Bacillus tuaregi]